MLYVVNKNTTGGFIDQLQTTVPTTCHQSSIVVCQSFMGKAHVLEDHESDSVHIWSSLQGQQHHVDVLGGSWCPLCTHMWCDIWYQHLFPMWCAVDVLCSRLSRTPFFDTKWSILTIDSSTKKVTWWHTFDIHTSRCGLIPKLTISACLLAENNYDK